MNKSFLILVTAILIISCKEQKKENAEVEATQATSEEVENTISIPDAWVDNRVKKAEERLTQTEAGKVVWASMEAHGGLDTWYKNGSLGMRFNYSPLDGKGSRDSYEVVDPWNNRVVHTSMEDSEAKFGFTGEETWLKAKDSTAFNYDVKFWALTPLYLMGHPFVEDGEGVNLELLPETTYKGKKNKLVKVTYDPGTGDAPDDYYILHFDADTYLLTATRYIVSYPEYFKEGGHNPEKFMEVGELVNVDGILLPSELKTHWTVDGKPGEYVTKIEITDLEFKSDLPTDFFDIPEGAKKL
ncbi:hypothetical protein [Allomuricauda sp. F6463D]|uniref:hypothetical protein n=1 Tax=Allomuricauda sp. F6463D TaxID=2926409 RepID=UPI001FF2864A|nr:hypothetical protein [Muricauda sp. F6463D]MCK0160402.1 hypothetical protein [Muricauda sp. F6463D]